jgi:hypothetical protein
LGENIWIFHFWTFINVHFSKSEILLGKKMKLPEIFGGGVKILLCEIKKWR